MFSKKPVLATFLALSAVILPVSSRAVTFFASDTIGGYTYSASADFMHDTLNNLLVITLTNTASAPAANQGQTLSGLYFDLTGNPVITKASANVGPGSTIVNDSPSLNDALIGREYAFRNNMNAAAATFTDARYGISSTGLNIFAPGDRFDTSGNLAGPASVAGDDFSIVPLSQVSFSSGGLTGTPFVRNAMRFTLHTPVGFNFATNSIQNVAFHYGSGQEFPTIRPPSEKPNVPEPGVTALLVGSAFPALWLLRRNRRRRK